MIFAFGVFFGWGTFTMMSDLPLWHRVYAMGVVSLFSLACMAAGGWVGWLWWTDYTNTAEINVEGIIDGKRFWSWDQISLIGGVLEGDDVIPGFQPSRSIIFRQLLAEPISRDAYDQFIKQIQAFLIRQYPHVKVRPNPVSSG